LSLQKKARLIKVAPFVSCYDKGLATTFTH
jgi:hypothetical protein